MPYAGQTTTPATAVSGATDAIAWIVNSNIKKEVEVEKVTSIPYRKLYRYATKIDIFLIVIAILSALLSGTVLPVTVYIESDLLEKMVKFDSYEDSEKGKKDEFWDGILYLGLLYISAGFGQCFVTYMSNAFINVSAVNQSNRIRMHYLRAALNQDAAYYDLKRSGDFASKMADDMNKVMDGIGDQVTVMISSVTLVLISLVWALVSGWKMALVCLSLVPVALLFISLAAWAADKYSKNEMHATSEASAVAEEVLSSVRTVYAFSGQQKELERYVKPLAKATKFSVRKDLFWGLSDGLIEFFMFTCYAFFFYVGIYLIIHETDKYNAGVFYNVYKNVSNVGFALGGMREHLTAFGEAKGAGAHIFRLIDNVPTINPLLSRGLKPVTLEGNIEFRGVMFRYATRPNDPVLKDFNLTIKRGQSVALVGATGSGKSTVIQLLCRFYDVVEGNVLLDDHDLRELSVHWLRSQVGLVGQEPVLFNTTVRDNIRYGREDASNEEIEEAAQKANAHFFIMKLPKGYDTLVGERGASLSGGQKQRVAIARALVRDPRVLLLDEATSALDAVSEAKVQMALDKAAEGRTTVIIAHRLSTIRNVTVIHVMHKGKIIESGSHTELMNLKGIYYDMVMIDDPGYVLKQDKSEKTTPSVSDVDTLFKDDIRDKEEESIPPLEAESLEVTKITKCKALSLNKPEWKFIATGCALTLLESVSLTTFGIFVSYLIASIPGSKSKDLMTKAYHCAALLVLFGIVTGNARFWQTFLFGISGARLTERLRRLMFQQMLRQEMGYFDDKRNSTGALCARLFGEAATVRSVTGFRIGHLLMAVTQIVVCILAAFYIDWRLALVSLVTFPVLITSFIKQSQAAKFESELHAKTMEESSQTAIEALSNYRTVASLGREAGVLAQYQKQLDPRRRYLLSSAHVDALVMSVNGGLRMLTTAAIMIYGGYLMVEEELRYALIFSLLQVAVATQQGAASLFSYAPDVQKGYYAAGRILQLLERETKIRDPDKPFITGFLGSGDGSFKNVRFRYPSRPNIEVLRQLNLRIQKGKTHALVGHSGCGKSTVIQLLQRYYDPDEGQITLDTIPINQLLVSDVRRTLGLVSQEPVLFDRSIAENIAYGDNTRSPTEEEIIEAAKQANIHFFIVSLPLGYDTNIGPKGTQLSGGQKQCVAIARALLRKPQILLLDEATSALDAENEKMVQATLDKAMAGRTCLLIAHRLSTVRDADVIFVIKNGRVKEQGSHEDLMSLRGHYYALNQQHSVN